MNRVNLRKEFFAVGIDRVATVLAAEFPGSPFKLQPEAEGADHTAYLLRLAELELLERERRMIERRIREARFPAVKSLDSFDFAAIPALNKMLVLELARGTSLEQRKNVIALGQAAPARPMSPSGSGWRPVNGPRRRLRTAAALVHELLEARDERRLLRLQKQLTAYKLLIVDELGYVPLSTERGGAPVRGLQPALRARLGPGHQQPALRRVDIRVRLGAADRRAPRPPHAPCPHPRDERRELPPESQSKAAGQGRDPNQRQLTCRSTSSRRTLTLQLAGTVLLRHPVRNRSGLYNVTHFPISGQNGAVDMVAGDLQAYAPAALDRDPIRPR